MVITGIASTSIFVKDQQESLNFWVEKVDFEVICDLELESNFRWVEIAPRSSNSSINLYPKSLISKKDLKPMPVIFFRTNDIHSTFNDLKARGVTFSRSPLKSILGIHAMFKDVDGNEFLILEKLKN
ncbi:MAG: VOC family protein [Nitrosopumilus sp.]|nr:VOC family protein [Nitrosopumilus sp.]MBA3750790.1 VOC family protein [Nitrosopumilus sp.]MDQ3083279.1 VOC family protein [Thermoproteota archaeon]